MSFHKDFIEGSIWFPKNIGTGVGQFGLVLEILTNDNSIASCAAMEKSYGQPFLSIIILMKKFYDL